MKPKINHKTIYRLAFVAVCLLIKWQPLAAQQSIIDHSFDTWWTLNNKLKLNDKLYLSSEIHVRRANGWKDWQQFVVRPALNYKHSDKLEFAVGYSYILTFPYGNQPISVQTPEHNFWEQATTKNQFGKLIVQNRYRLEHRFIGHATSTDNLNYYIDGTDFRQRFRYRFTAVYPINERLSLKGFNEIWWNLNHSLMPDTLNQNWLYGGLNYKVNSALSTDLGFMNQRIKKNDHIHYESNSTLQLTIGYSF